MKDVTSYLCSSIHGNMYTAMKMAIIHSLTDSHYINDVVTRDDKDWKNRNSN